MNKSKETEQRNRDNGGDRTSKNVAKEFFTLIALRLLIVAGLGIATLFAFAVMAFILFS